MGLADRDYMKAKPLKRVVRPRVPWAVRLKFLLWRLFRPGRR